MIDYKIVGERIKKARLEKGMSQVQVASKIGFSVAFLSRVERGSANISLTRLNQLCDILEIEEGILLNGTSLTSNYYLSSDFKEVFDKCNEKQKKLIYKIAKIISKN